MTTKTTTESYFLPALERAPPPSPPRARRAGSRPGAFCGAQPAKRGPPVVLVVFGGRRDRERRWRSMRASEKKTKLADGLSLPLFLPLDSHLQQIRRVALAMCELEDPYSRVIIARERRDMRSKVRSEYSRINIERRRRGGDCRGGVERAAGTRHSTGTLRL